MRNLFSKNYINTYSLVILLGCIFFVFKLYFFVDVYSNQSYNFKAEGWETVMLKANDLTNSLQHIKPYLWTAKKVFRLTLPVFIRLLSLKPQQVVLFQVFLGLFLYVYSYKLVKKILLDSKQALLVTVGISTTYFGSVAFYDIYPTWFDTFSFFFLLMAMYLNNPIWIFSFASLAAWTDERAFLALIIVYLFHFLQEKQLDNLNLRSLIKPGIKEKSVVFAFVMYIIIRLMLTVVFDMKTPSDGANFMILKRTWKYLPVGIFTFFEGFWMVFIFIFFKLLQSKKYEMFSLLFVLIFVFSVISGFVTDITRSGSFFFPILYIFLLFLKNQVNQRDIGRLLTASVYLTLLIPPIFVCADWTRSAWFYHTGTYFFQYLLAPLYY